MRRIILSVYPLAVAFVLGLFALPTFAADRPNIVWIFAEDMNDWMGCYGDDTVPTPNIDSLAKNGVRFNRAYMPAGVCSATRSAIALGAMQTSLGVHNHRSSRQRYPGEEIRLPYNVKTVYQTLRDGGYHVVNYGPKSDFNFLWASQNKKELSRPKGTSAIPAESDEDLLYDENVLPWAPSNDLLPQLLKACPKDKPAFLQLQLRGGKNNGKFEGFREKQTSPEAIRVMPYYADLPSVRDAIAHHYDCIRQTDEEVGQILKTLKENGFDKNTVVFFFTDHGMVLPRHKQWLYEGGIRVPLVIAGPGIPEGKTRDDLVSGIDISATTLALAGIERPQHMEAKDFFADDFHRDFVVSARDRCDYTIERVRAVTGERMKYIRNFKIDRPFMQPQYRDGMPFMKDLKAHYEAGKMNEVESYIMSETREPEELYNLYNDPEEIHNLAGDPAYREELEKYRGILDQWIEQTGDQGQHDESATSLKGVLKQWSEQAVNPEYDKAR